MKFHHPTADLFVPDHLPLAEAFQRITHLGIGAHQDDLEFMAFHGILTCFKNREKWFGGVTCTNGTGSSRTGPYAAFDDGQMKVVRRQEQNAAAVIGGYAAMVQLDYPSRSISYPAVELRDDLRKILIASQPEIIYTHNPADKHDTHIGVMIAALEAIRDLPPAQRPRQVIGCEVWRSLDWLPDSEKVLMDVSGDDELAAALNGVFDSQIAGGKRYDRATLGRRAANATFLDSHSTDQATQLILGLDLTPLILDRSIDIVEYTCELISRFQKDVRNRLSAHMGSY